MKLSELVSLLEDDSLSKIESKYHTAKVALRNLQEAYKKQNKMDESNAIGSLVEELNDVCKDS